MTMLDLIEYTGSTDQQGETFYKGANDGETALILKLQKALGVKTDGLLGQETVDAYNERHGTNIDATWLVNHMAEAIKAAESFWTPTRKYIGWGVGILGVLGGIVWWKRRGGGGPMSGVFSRGRLSGGSLGRTRQQSKFSAAAKSCKGRKLPAFRSCMSKKLRS